MGGNVETLPWLRGGACQMGVESPYQKTACQLVRLTGKNQPEETLRCAHVVESIVKRLKCQNQGIIITI